MEYLLSAVDCPFCESTESVLENELAFVLRDNFPVAKGHSLVCTKRHVPNCFGATKEEHSAVQSLIFQCRELLDRELSPDGYNVGINIGEAAGQTVMHFHVHLIPRYFGDVIDPRGGVRGVIPAKQKY